MLDKNKIYDVIIVGGGVIGISIAYKLSKSNFTCAVIEKNYLGSGATQAAAGVISPLFYGEDQINSPMRQMRELSYEMFLKLQDEFEELEIQCPFNKSGIFRTAFDDKELALLKNLSDLTSKLGVKSELITNRKQKKELNFLSEDIIGGMFFPDEGYVDGLDYVNKLKSAILKMGSDIFENEEFIDFKVINDNTNQVITSKHKFLTNNIVFATGSTNILQKYNISEDLMIDPVKGQYILVRSKEFEIPYTIGDGSYGQSDEGPSYQGYLVPRNDGIIYIGASKHYGIDDNIIELEGINFCLEVAKKYLGSIENFEFISAHSGIRPQSKKGTPIIKKLFDNDNILFVSGHFTQGMMLSLGTAEIIKNYLTKSDEKLFNLFNEM